MSTPNYSLAVALAAARWSNHETARRIVDAATQQGHRHIAVHHTRVSRWIRHGEKPHPPVPELLAGLLTEHLGQLHTPQSLRLLRPRYLRIPLEELEHQVVMQRATAANLSAEDYVHRLIRTALRDHEGPVRVKSQTPAEATTPAEAAKH
ncbi:hypothetical protein ACFYOY_35580 [Streptomyces sp. NPDC007875]|uniref:hypothetical protein n=1 Tax=Streptomyces sp. NPDC007875 TaxID=3364783 RepID=UPI0036B0E4C6